jgi:cell division protein FtsB
MDNILNKVNRVATLRAQIAEMAKEEKELIAEMKDFGTGVYQGTEHQIVISESTRRT